MRRIAVILHEREQRCFACAQHGEETAARLRLVSSDPHDGLTAPVLRLMMTNINCTVLYVGVTADLTRRALAASHRCRRGLHERYNLTRLACSKHFRTVSNAIAGEKQIKAGSGMRNALIRSAESALDDLAADGIRRPVSSNPHCPDILSECEGSLLSTCKMTAMFRSALNMTIHQ